MSHHFRRIQYFKASSSCFAGTGCLCCLLLHFHVILSVSLAFSRHLLGIFLACLTYAQYCCEVSQHSYICPVMFEGFHIFQSFFFVFCRDRMFVLLIVIFGTRCLCCLSLHFHMLFLSVFLTFSWHFLDIS